MEPPFLAFPRKVTIPPRGAQPVFEHSDARLWLNGIAGVLAGALLVGLALGVVAATTVVTYHWLTGVLAR